MIYDTEGRAAAKVEWLPHAGPDGMTCHAHDQTGQQHFPDDAAEGKRTRR